MSDAFKFVEVPPDQERFADDLGLAWKQQRARVRRAAPQVSRSVRIGGDTINRLDAAPEPETPGMREHIVSGLREFAERMKTGGTLESQHLLDRKT